MNFIAVDPGLSGTGYVVIEDGELIDYGNIYPSEKELRWKAQQICWHLQTVVLKFKIREAFIEWPTGQFSSAKGIAAKNTDAILKLCYLIGRIDEALAPMKTFEFVKVVQHIGQLPKEINHKRVNKYFNSCLKSHAADAGSIAKYVLTRKIK